MLQTDRCAEGKQLRRKPILDLLITKSKPQFPLRGEFFWLSSLEASGQHPKLRLKYHYGEAKANICLVALRPSQQPQLKHLQLKWSSRDGEPSLDFCYKSLITTNSMTVSFCAAHLSLVTHWTTSGGTQRVHFWLVEALWWTLCFGVDVVPQLSDWTSQTRGIPSSRAHYGLESRSLALASPSVWSRASWPVKYCHISGHINPSINVYSQANNTAVIMWNQATTIQYLQMRLD